MLTTDDRNEMQAFPFMRLPGIKSWRLVGLELRRPYFLVSYGCKEKRTWVTQTALLWQEDDLRAFCDKASANPERRIYLIAMMAPPESTKLEMWDWKVLREIWICEVRNCVQRVMLYVPAEGERLFSPPVVVDEKKLNFTKKIFQMADMPAEMNTNISV